MTDRHTRAPQLGLALALGVGIVAVSIFPLHDADSSTGDTRGDRTEAAAVDPHDPATRHHAPWNFDIPPEAANLPRFGPPLDWTKLATLLPASIEGFESSRNAHGLLRQVAGDDVSSATRRYEKGGEALYVTLTDTSMAPMLRGPFVAAAMQAPNEALSDVNGHQAIEEYRAATLHSRVRLLVAGRFVVDVRRKPNPDPDAARKIAQALDVGWLVRVQSERQRELGTPQVAAPTAPDTLAPDGSVPEPPERDEQPQAER